MRHFVYALCEPDGRTIRYIGCSKNLWVRLHGHVNTPQPELREWVLGLRKAGKLPSMIVLCECPSKELGLIEESRRISEAKAKYGDQILNANKTNYPILATNELVEWNGQKRTLGSWAVVLGVRRRDLVEGLRHATAEELFPTIRAELANEAAAVERFLNEVQEVTPDRLSRRARRERRRLIAEEVLAGDTPERVAARYGVGVAMVNLAVRRYEPIAAKVKQ